MVTAASDLVDTIAGFVLVAGEPLAVIFGDKDDKEFEDILELLGLVNCVQCTAKYPTPGKDIPAQCPQ